MKLLFLVLSLTTMIWADAHIYTYHRVNDSRHPSTNITTEELRKEFEYFKNNGYEVIPLEKLINALRNKEEISDRWIVLTIDDNYKSFYEHGLPLFKEFNYPFTLFVYVNSTELKYGDYMTWQQIQETAKYGSLEFHSLNHPHMRSMSEEALKKDFEEGLALFEKRLGKKPRYFAYPFGEYNNRVKAIAKSYGFEALLNQNASVITSSSDPLNLDRLALGTRSNIDNLLKHQTLKMTKSKDANTSHIRADLNQSIDHNVSTQLLVKNNQKQ